MNDWGRTRRRYIDDLEGFMNSLMLGAFIIAGGAANPAQAVVSVGNASIPVLSFVSAAALATFLLNFTRFEFAMAALLAFFFAATAFSNHLPIEHWGATSAMALVTSIFTQGVLNYVEDARMGAPS